MRSRVTLFALLITIVSAPAYAQVLVNGYYVLLDDGGDFGISEGEYSRKGSSEFLAHNAIPVGVECDPEVLDLVAAVIRQNYSDVDFGTVFFANRLPDDEAVLECAIELLTLIEVIFGLDTADPADVPRDGYGVCKDGYEYQCDDLGVECGCAKPSGGGTHFASYHFLMDVLGQICDEERLLYKDDAPECEIELLALVVAILSQNHFEAEDMRNDVPRDGYGVCKDGYTYQCDDLGVECGCAKPKGSSGSLTDAPQFLSSVDPSEF